jgi:hypothetical protein
MYKPGFDASDTRADIILMAGGTLTLLDPTGKPESFYYGRTAREVSFAESRALRLPKLRLPDLDRFDVEALSATSSDGAKAVSAGQRANEPHAPGDGATPPQAADSSDGEKQARARALKTIARETKELTKNSADERTKASAGNGSIFMTHAFTGAELLRSDLRGAVVFVHGDAETEVLAGPRRSVMLLGINAAELMMGLSSSAMSGLAEHAIGQARALMLIDAGNDAPTITGPGVVVGFLN